MDNMCFRRNQNRNIGQTIPTQATSTQTDAVYPSKIASNFNPFSERKQPNSENYENDRNDSDQNDVNEWNKNRNRNSSRDDYNSRDKYYSRNDRNSFKRKRSRDRTPERTRDRSRERNSYRNDRERRSRDRKDKRTKNSKYYRNSDDIIREPYNKRSRQEPIDSRRNDIKPQERCDNNYDNKKLSQKKHLNLNSNSNDRDRDRDRESIDTKLIDELKQPVEVEAEEGEIVDSQEMDTENNNQKNINYENKMNLNDVDDDDYDNDEPKLQIANNSNSEENVIDKSENEKIILSEIEKPKTPTIDIAKQSYQLNTDLNHISNINNIVENNLMNLSQNGCEIYPENILSKNIDNNNDIENINSDSIEKYTDVNLTTNDRKSNSPQLDIDISNASLSKSIRNISTNSSDYQIVEDTNDEIVVYVTRKKGHKSKEKKKKKDKKKEKEKL